MSFIKTYFLCPTSDFLAPFPAGPLRLGSILRSTSMPQFPLNAASVVPVDEEAAQPPAVETNWKKTVSTETGAGFGVYAQFLQFATGGGGGGGGASLGPELDVDRSGRTASAFAFDTLTTVSFEPTPRYVHAAVHAPAVQAYLKEPKQRFAPVVSLFLVTGLKLVKGAKIKYSTSTSTSVTGNVGAYAAPLGMTVGPKGHWTRAKDDETEFERDSEFVFAFRVKRLRMGRTVKSQEYNKGAFLAIGQDHPDDEPVLVDDVDGSHIESATLIPDAAENGNVYCIAPYTYISYTTI